MDAAAAQKLVEYGFDEAGNLTPLHALRARDGRIRHLANDLLARSARRMLACTASRMALALTMKG